MFMAKKLKYMTRFVVKKRSPMVYLIPTSQTSTYFFWYFLHVPKYFAYIAAHWFFNLGRNLLIAYCERPGFNLFDVFMYQPKPH